MKKQYKKPEINIEILNDKDVILASDFATETEDKQFEFEIDFGEIKF